MKILVAGYWFLFGWCLRSVFNLKPKSMLESWVDFDWALFWVLAIFGVLGVLLWLL